MPKIVRDNFISKKINFYKCKGDLLAIAYLYIYIYIRL